MNFFNNISWTQPCLISTSLVLYSARTETRISSITFHWTQPRLISTRLVLYSARTETRTFSIKFHWTQPCLISTSLVLYSARTKTCIFFNEIALNSALCYKYQARTVFFFLMKLHLDISTGIVLYPALTVLFPLSMALCYSFWSPYVTSNTVVLVFNCFVWFCGSCRIFIERCAWVFCKFWLRKWNSFETTCAWIS